MEQFSVGHTISLSRVESGGKISCCRKKGKDQPDLIKPKINNMMQGTGRELLSEGMQVRLLGATGGLGLEPTSAVHTQE